MNWKDFFKPKLSKFLILMFIFILTIVLRGLIARYNLQGLSFIEKLISPHYLIQTLATPVGVQDGVLGPINIFFMLFGFLIGLFYWYVLSCLIILLFNKIRK